MPRWEADPQGRLEEAALSLFAEQGYDATSIAGIAERAGLTERSFYRWFRDKREVLFGAQELSTVLVAALAAVPPGVEALPALLIAFRGVAPVLRGRPLLRRRAAVVAETPALQERELMKLEALARDLVNGLQRRGSSTQDARLAVDVGMAVLRSATEEWLADDTADFAQALAANEVRLTQMTSARQLHDADLLHSSVGQSSVKRREPAGSLPTRSRTR